MFNVSLEYAYTFVAIAFAILWLVIFVWNKEHYSRKKQLTVSCFFAVIGPISEVFYFSDYWHPLSVWSGNFMGVPLLVEDVIFGFAFGGIASVSFGLLAGRHRTTAITKRNHLCARLLVTDIAPIAIVFLLFFLGVNSIFAGALGALLGTFAILSQRNDLWLDALGSGIVTVLVMFFCYKALFLLAANEETLFSHIWFLYETPLDVRFFGIPFTELFFGFAFGTVISPWYEFNFDLLEKNKQ